jgi:caffeoyl-CoA O-methyltransferase
MISKEIEDYSESHTEPESSLLRQLNRETHSRVLNPRMLSGHLQGRLLSLLSKLVSPRRILEIGTYTGYSALCLAEGLVNDGLLITIDVNEELESRARHYFQLSGKADQIRMITGDAKIIIPTLDESFDLVFIDADKLNYAAYFDLIIDKVRSGGLIIADNVLWSGKVTGSNLDKKTNAILEFNQKVHSDTRVSNLLLPVRDGLMILQKN